MLSKASGIEESGDKEGRTALMWAAQRGNYPVLNTLLQAGSNPNTVDLFGASGLALLYTHVHWVVLLWVLTHGTPLIWTPVGENKMRFPYFKKLVLGEGFRGSGLALLCMYTDCGY